MTVAYEALTVLFQWIQSSLRENKDSLLKKPKQPTNQPRRDYGKGYHYVENIQSKVNEHL